MKAQDRLIRLLGLVPYLREHPGVGVAEAAEVFQITPKQLIADLKMLWMCGLPGGLPDDLIEIDMDALDQHGVIHLGNADYLSRPMKLGSDEILGLVVALRLLEELAPAQARQTIAGVLAKLAGPLSEGSVPVDVQVVKGSETLKDQLIGAIAAKKRVQLIYHGTEHTTSPLVDPFRLDVIDGYLYLQAWSLLAGAWRTYRLDRMEQVTDTGEMAEAHDNAPEAGQWRFESPVQLVLKLKPAGQWAAECFPNSVISEPGEEMRIALPVVSKHWALSLILRLGPDAELIDSASLGREAAAEAAAALEQYAALSSTTGYSS